MVFFIAAICLYIYLFFKGLAYIVFYVCLGIFLFCALTVRVGVEVFQTATSKEHRNG
jgi:hypothetical protein